MKVIFAGTPEFAAVALRVIAAAGHDIPLVLTQPDRPAGRGMALQASPVKRLAQELGIEVFQPLSLKDPAAQATVGEIGADVMVVAAYGLILPQTVLDMPRFGCINIHASLLPRWRGAAPIQRAILAGDEETGVCIMQMEAGLDTGPVLLRGVLPIGAEATAGDIHDRLADLGGKLIVDCLARLPLPAETQSEAGVTYAAKLEKAEAAIDWRWPATEVDRLIRAFNPFPGAQAMLKGGGVKVWRARPVDGRGEPGEILAAGKEGIAVACGEGAILITEVQKAGGKRLPAMQFLAGNALAKGDRFDPLP
ncbi:MAG TPA: methionyl-tRNA formyltransferase [Rhodocyclaceae bacterium]|nr:methionyl-tRNA formyltransferase [Rhodocyclaceae bacterium]